MSENKQIQKSAGSYIPPSLALPMPPPLLNEKEAPYSSEHRFRCNGELIWCEKCGVVARDPEELRCDDTFDAWGQLPPCPYPDPVWLDELGLFRRHPEDV